MIANMPLIASQWLNTWDLHCFWFIDGHVCWQLQGSRDGLVCWLCAVHRAVASGAAADEADRMAEARAVKDGLDGQIYGPVQIKIWIFRKDRVCTMMLTMLRRALLAAGGCRKQS